MFTSSNQNITTCFTRFQILPQASGDLRKAVPEPSPANHERIYRSRASDPVDVVHVPEHVPIHQRHQGQAQLYQALRASQL